MKYIYDIYDNCSNIFNILFIYMEIKYYFFEFYYSNIIKILNKYSYNLIYLN